MKFLYYTLYLFYVKIIKLHKQYPPIINITAVISVLFTLFICSIVNAYYYDIGYKYPPYNFIIPGIGYLILWKLLYEYYKSKESKLIESMNMKPSWIKASVVVFSVLLIILIVKLWMFDGSIKLYQLIKEFKFGVKSVCLEKSISLVQ